MLFLVRIIPIYISLMKLTKQGITNIKDAPKRVENATQIFESMGGKIHAFYFTMGEYDKVVIAEAPNDETVMTMLAALGSYGNVRTTTLKAFTKDEFAKILSSLP